MRTLNTLLVCSLLLAANASASIITYTAILTGSQETPPNPSTATGNATVTVDTSANTLLVQESFSGLTGGVATGAHIHCCVAPGTATGIALPFPIPPFPAATSGTFVQTFDLLSTATYTSGFLTANGGTAAGAETGLINGLNAGLAYVNIHDATFPGGEIRGQLGAVPEPTTAALCFAGLALGMITRVKSRRK